MKKGEYKILRSLFKPVENKYFNLEIGDQAADILIMFLDSTMCRGL